MHIWVFPYMTTVNCIQIHFLMFCLLIIYESGLLVVDKTYRKMNGVFLFVIISIFIGMRKRNTSIRKVVIYKKPYLQIKQWCNYYPTAPICVQAETLLCWFFSIVRLVLLASLVFGDMTIRIYFSQKHTKFFEISRLQDREKSDVQPYGISRIKAGPCFYLFSLWFSFQVHWYGVHSFHAFVTIIHFSSSVMIQMDLINISFLE